MGNYRTERVFVALQRPIPGVDPLKAIDPYALASCYTDRDALTLGLTPLSEFLVADFDGPAAEPYVEPRRWFKAATGLKTVRGILKHYRELVAKGQDPSGRPIRTIQENVVVLEALETVLAEAHAERVRFCLLAKDLD